MYYKNSVLSKILDIHYLLECINFEIKIGDKFCNFISLYILLGQTNDTFDTFANNSELNLDLVLPKSPFLIVVSGDFNAQTIIWYNKCKTTQEGSKIDGVTSCLQCLHQITKKQIHKLNDSSSYIVLIFTLQPNLAKKSRPR